MLIPFDKQEFMGNNGYVLSMQGDYQTLYDENGKVVYPKDQQIINLPDGKSKSVLIHKQNGERICLVDRNDKIPASLAWINPQMMSMNEEVSIYQYLLFLGSVKLFGSEFSIPGTDEKVPLSELIPDTNQIEEKVNPFWRKISKIMNDPSYDVFETLTYSGFGFPLDCEIPFKLSKEEEVVVNYPLTGITWKQANYFAIWLTDKFSEYSNPEMGYSFKMVIPSPEQWNEIAMSGLSDSMKKNGVLDSLNSQGCFLYNFANVPDCKNYAGYMKNSQGGGAASVVSFNRDFNGVYNIFGNVCEMTSTEGIAKGGSYFHPAKYASVSNSQTYSGPKP